MKSFNLVPKTRTAISAALALSFLALFALGTIYFGNVGAQSRTADEKTADSEPLAIGRLAYGRRTVGFGVNDGFIYTSNPDGTNDVALVIPSNLTPVQPAWSPDGTKMAYASEQSNSDIFSVNVTGGGVVNLTNTASPIVERNPSWSSLGKIAYERESSIWTMNADGSGQAQFPGIAQPSPAAPSWSPTGLKLAYTSGGDIWVINSDSTNPLQLTSGATVENDPAWSPDGTKVIYRKGSSGIAIINVDGTNEVVLPSTGGASTPSWSPDGSLIAFARNGVWTMSADGSNQTVIKANSTNFPNCCDTIYENPAWQPVAQTANTYVISGGVTYNNLPMIGATVNLTGSSTATTTTNATGNFQFAGLPEGGNYTVTPVVPNHQFAPASRSFTNLTSNVTSNFEVSAVCIGQRCFKNGKIAFGQNGDIFTVNPDGTAKTNTTNSASFEGEPTFSPDGTMIVFETTRDGNFEIYKMNVGGGFPVRLTNNTAEDRSPAFSPDGSAIVFSSFRDGNYELYKMNADGTNQVRLTNDTDSQTAPSFSPDGSKIVFLYTPFQQRVRLATVNADGTNLQVFSYPISVSPTYSRPTYSPDGSKIIFSYSSDVITFRRTGWIMNADGTNRTEFPGIGDYAVFSPDGTKTSYVNYIPEFSSTLFTADADGTRPRSFPNTPASTPSWQASFQSNPTEFDFDGDRRADVAVFRPSQNKWYILQSSSGTVRETTFAIPGDIAVPSDYDGDGKTDVAIYRPSTGDWWYLSSINNGQIPVHWGEAGDIPRPSDFDGDGKSDFVVYRPSNGVWYRYGSTGATSIIAFGAPGDQPLVGDFDGDGKSDPAVFRPSSGDWWYAASTQGNSHRSVHWGQNGDIPVAGDFDGDNKTDFVVFRPSDGGWYILYSTNTYTITAFGTNGDRPIAADYDGDGKADVAVFRPSTGIWYLLQTTAGFGALQWGLSGDVPTPNAFTP